MKGQRHMNQASVYINGEWVGGSSKHDVVSPVTGKVIGAIVYTEPSLIDEAVSTARAASPGWRSTSTNERCQILGRFADLLMREYSEANEPTRLKSLISDEMGKRFPEADIEVVESADMVRYFADHAEELLQPQEVTIESELWVSKRSSLRFDPHGVVAVIKPWNYPLELPLWSIAPALAAGNTVVFKPSELSGLIGLEIARLFEEAGLPAGVLNVVTGDAGTGSYLTRHPGIDMIGFTGSRSTGIKVATAAATNITPVSLELGGNDAALVLEDADLELATNGIAWGGVCNSGQVCVGVKRVFVHESISKDFESLLVEKVANLKPGVDYGPIISEQQLRKLEKQVSETVREGATNLLGGTRLPEAGTLYYAPTVLSGVRRDMTISLEECFGPVIPITSYEGPDQTAVDLANESSYGLGTSIWTSDIQRGAEVATHIETGMVWVNDVNVAIAEGPWGGRKDSGYGVELSPWGLYKYTILKHVNVETSKEARRDWWYPYSEA